MASFAFGIKGTETCDSWSGVFDLLRSCNAYAILKCNDFKFFKEHRGKDLKSVASETLSCAEILPKNKLELVTEEVYKELSKLFKQFNETSGFGDLFSLFFNEGKILITSTLGNESNIIITYDLAKRDYIKDTLTSNNLYVDGQCINDCGIEPCIGFMFKTSATHRKCEFGDSNVTYQSKDALKFIKLKCKDSDLAQCIRELDNNTVLFLREIEKFLTKTFLYLYEKYRIKFMIITPNTVLFPSEEEAKRDTQFYSPIYVIIHDAISADPVSVCTGSSKSGHIFESRLSENLTWEFDDYAKKHYLAYGSGTGSLF